MYKKYGNLMKKMQSDKECRAKKELGVALSDPMEPGCSPHLVLNLVKKPQVKIIVEGLFFFNMFIIRMVVK